MFLNFWATMQLTNLICSSPTRVILSRFRRPLQWLLLVAILAAPMHAHGQLRVVTYNTLQGPRAGLDTVLQAIGEEQVGGIARPIDVLLLQEQTGPSFDPQETTDDIVTLLNNIYGAGTYDSGNVNGGPVFTNSLRQTIVYNSNTVQLVGEQALGTTSVNSQTRQVLRHQVRPLGYDSSADFYIYNSHYKAGLEDDSASNSNLTNGERRNIEAMTIRSDADALGSGASIIYVGDFNMRSSNEDAFQTLIAGGNGQAHDPIDSLGNWNNNSSFADIHTQSTCTNSSLCPGFATGGVDDRFDFQLVSGELEDQEGLDYLPGSYHAFGNNGSTFNDAINDGNSISINGLTSFSTAQVLDALATASDHLPVVADYQIPAFMNATIGSVPGTLDQGQFFNLDLLIRNAANVQVAGGADELEYSFSTTGDLIGSGSGVEFALGAGDSFPVTLDTSTEGEKSGSIVVTTSSPGAGNSSITIPVNYTVGEATGGTPVVIARAVFPTVADDINVNSLQFSGGFTTEDTDNQSGGTLPVGSDARTLAFANPGDIFGLEDRQDDSPFSVLDDSDGSFATDELGIIGSSDFDNFFGVSDTQNGDNGGALTAEWAFDISSATSDLKLSIDIAAMGDFETSDEFQFEVSIDGNPFTSIFTVAVDEAISQTYTLEGEIQPEETAPGELFEGQMAGGPRVITVDDPLRVDGTLLSNEFQTFMTPLAGTGDELVLRFTATADGGSEAFVFRNIVIEGLIDDPLLAGDYNQDGVVDATDYAIWRDALGSMVDLAADGNDNGVIDSGDYDIWRENFGATQPAGLLASQGVPEPTTAWLAFATVGLAIGRWRRPRV